VNPLAPLRATETVLARWAENPAPLPLETDLQPLRRHGPRAAVQRLVRLEQLAQRHSLEGPNYQAVALAVLTDAPDWRELVFHLLLLPALRAHPGDLDVATFMEEWTTNLLGALTPAQVGALADACLGHADAPLREALRFWGRPEVVPVLLSRLRDAVGQRDRAGVLGQLEGVVRLLAGAERLRANLAETFAAMLAATVSGQAPLPGEFLRELLAEQEPICRLLGVKPPPAGWYEDAVCCVEAFAPDEALAQLRQAWARDLLWHWSGRAGASPGRLLLPELYQVWCRRTPLPEPATELLVALCEDTARLDCLPADLLLARAAGYLEACDDPVRAAAVALNTEAMLGGPLPVATRATLLARLVHRAAPLQGAELLAALRRRPEVCQAVADMAAVRQYPRDGVLGTLLWEVVFATPRRRPLLRARLLAVVDRADVPPAPPPAFLRAAGRLLAALCTRPESGEERRA
jgi:hypothetical protein